MRTRFQTRNKSSKRFIGGDIPIKLSELLVSYKSHGLIPYTENDIKSTLGNYLRSNNRLYTSPVSYYYQLDNGEFIKIKIDSKNADGIVYFLTCFFKNMSISDRQTRVISLEEARNTGKLFVVYDGYEQLLDVLNNPETRVKKYIKTKEYKDIPLTQFVYRNPVGNNEIYGGGVPALLQCNDNTYITVSILFKNNKYVIRKPYMINTYSGGMYEYHMSNDEVDSLIQSNKFFNVPVKNGGTRHSTKRCSTKRRHYKQNVTRRHM